MSDVVATAQQGLTGKYQPYPEYKDSGVEWLGDVPEHWVLSRVKDVAVVFGGYPFDSQRFSPDVGVPLIRIRDINTELTAVYFDGDVPQEAIVENNDVLIGMDGEFNVARWKGGKAALNQRVACVRTDSDELTALLFYTLPFNLKVVNDLTYYTTVKHLSLEDIKKTIFALPQGEELSNIVAFLDYETARIDRLIAQQQRLIELLKEKRQAVISHAVTKGLNPDAPMKDSGIEWLGQVPEHWDVLPIQRLLKKVEQGSSPVAENRVPEDGEYGVLKISAIKKGKFITTEVKTLDSFTHYSSRFKVNMGDLLVTRANTPSLVADVCVVDAETSSPTMMSDLIYRLVTTDAVDNTFLCSWLLSDFGRMQIEIDARGSSMTMAKVSQGHIKSWLAILPPLGEQIEINTFLATKQEKFEKLIYKAESAISLMNERRTALISAAVTGKIDLRGWMPPAEEAAA